MSTRQRHHGTQPGIVLRRRPDREINSPTGLERLVQVGERANRFGKKHASKARTEPVVRRIRHSHTGGVSTDKACVGYTFGRSAASGGGDQIRRNVDPQHFAARCHGARNGHAGCAAPKTDIEHTVTRAIVGVGQQGFADRGDCAFKPFEIGQPALTHFT